MCDMTSDMTSQMAVMTSDMTSQMAISVSVSLEVPATDSPPYESSLRRSVLDTLASSRKTDILCKSAVIIYTHVDYREDAV